MKMPRPLRELLDRISGRPAADDRDARLERVAQQIDSATRRHLRILEERQEIQRRPRDA